MGVTGMTSAPSSWGMLVYYSVVGLSINSD